MSPRWEPNPDIRRGRTVVYHLHAHLVFVTKYRRGVLDDEMLTRCEEVMRKVCEDFGAELKEFNGETDHVHLLVHYPRRNCSTASRACPLNGYATNTTHTLLWF
jgi:putative transposase